MHLSALDIIVIFVYVSGMLALAQFASRVPLSKEDQDYAPKRRALPWWAIGTSLIAANISAEQIIGMSGSAYAFGLAIASYEWMAAATLLVVGKFLLPVFLHNQIYTMPEFLRRRFGRRLQLVMAASWIGIYVFVALTAILWLGATAVHAVTGLTLWVSLILLGLFAGNYALYMGSKTNAWADVVQVSMLGLGGLVIVGMALVRISGSGGISGLLHGFSILTARAPEHFHLILTPDNPYYKYVPGLSVLIGGMWIINLGYWGFNQNIVQRALAAKSIREVQNGVVLAAFLKLLMPVLVVLPGIAGAVLIPHLSRPDEAYPTLMTFLPSGLLGLVFVALVAAIIASMRSTLLSIGTIFAVDIFGAVDKKTTERQLVIAGRLASIAGLFAAMVAAEPLLGHFDQAYQYIQEYNGFLTPGVVVVFLLGIFWTRTTEEGALAAAISSPLASVIFALFFPQIPFMNRMVYVLLIGLVLAVGVSLLKKSKVQYSTIDVTHVDYRTGKTFNIAALAVIGALVALYVVWW